MAHKHKICVNSFLPIDSNFITNMLFCILLHININKKSQVSSIINIYKSNLPMDMMPETHNGPNITMLKSITQYISKPTPLSLPKSRIYRNRSIRIFLTHLFASIINIFLILFGGNLLTFTLCLLYSPIRLSHRYPSILSSRGRRYTRTDLGLCPGWAGANGRCSLRHRALSFRP